MRNLLWDVYAGDGPAVQVHATSAAQAVRRLRETSSKPVIDPWAHRPGCKCKKLRQECEKGVLEVRLQGTPLGRLANL